MGFGHQCTKLIMTRVSTAAMSILLNGSPLKPFMLKKGLRKADPLSLYLLNLVSKAFITLIRRVENSGLVKAVIIGKNNVLVEHLQFAETL